MFEIVATPPPPKKPSKKAGVPKSEMHKLRIRGAAIRRERAKRVERFCRDLCPTCEPIVRVRAEALK